MRPSETSRGCIFGFRRSFRFVLRGGGPLGFLQEVEHQVGLLAAPPPGYLPCSNSVRQRLGTCSKADWYVTSSGSGR